MPSGRPAWTLLLGGVGLLSLLLNSAHAQEAEPSVVVEAPPRPLAAVTVDHAEQMTASGELFKLHVRDLLTERCLRCHGGEANEGGLDLSDRERLLAGGDSGPAIEVGDPENSYLMMLVRHEFEPTMPQEASKLPDAELEHLARWIELGAAYPEPLVDDTQRQIPWTEKRISDADRAHWAYQPLRETAPPTLDDEQWALTEIDLFIRAAQREAGVTPNPVAAKRTLIRRAYLDLWGMPPEPDDVAAFLAEDSPEAWARVVDRLLASPHYGERWARHWLDLARYAESHGFEHDYDRPGAYHYRDFVIQALNQDLPYDTFVRWQLAGDEYAPQNELAMMATGFLAAGVHSTQITKSEVVKHRYDEMDDMLATVGTAMLGLTIGCARCHDHKYDAFPQADYYRLLSTFTTTIRSDVSLQRQEENFAALQEQFAESHAPYEQAVTEYEQTTLPGQFAAWESASGARAAAESWLVLIPERYESVGGATLEPQADGSLRATGENPRFDHYTFSVTYSGDVLQQVRIEALADDSLVKRGPGRAANGNFDLTDFRLLVAPADGTSEPRQITLVDPTASFEQQGLPLAAAIDDDPQSGWAVDPQFGKDHAGAFMLSEPLDATGGLLLTFELDFQGNDQHNIGRVRLSASGAEQPLEPAAEALSQEVQMALATAADERTEAQRAMLLKWYRSRDQGWRELEAARVAHLKLAPQATEHPVLICSEGVEPVKLHTQAEQEFLPETHFLRRGDVTQKEAVAEQSFLQVLMGPQGSMDRWYQSPPEAAQTSWRRRALAEWLTDTDQGAGMLLARVMVNRLWQHHFGTGIVSTPSDFGTRGEAPTHPELLDWLAARLIAENWQLKPLHRLMMTSQVYRLAATEPAANMAVDAQNQLYWRFEPRRLEAEAIRDAMLSVSGCLDPTLYGPSTLDETMRRRSIYFKVKRSELVSMLQVFDWPEALSGLAERSTTTVAPQALMLLNSPQVRDWAESFAGELITSSPDAAADQVCAAYERALSRQPTEAELEQGVVFLSKQAESYREENEGDSLVAEQAALADFCQTLFCLNEFVYIR